MRSEYATAMTPIRYKARILPDGHLPVPEELQAHAGDEVEVTVAPAVATDGETLARERWEYFKRTWLGKFRSGCSDLAANHDEYLYGRQ
jgi:hypothetical protein